MSAEFYNLSELCDKIQYCKPKIHYGVNPKQKESDFYIAFRIISVKARI